MPASVNSDQYAAGMPQHAADMLFLSSELDRQGILYLLWVQSNGYDVQPLLEQYKRTWRNIRDVHPWMCKALKNLMHNARDDGQPIEEPYAMEFCYELCDGLCGNCQYYRLVLRPSLVFL